MGLHAGPVIIGRIGHSHNATVTVVGSTVNAASRLETLTKEHGCQLIVSAAVAAWAGFRPGVGDAAGEALSVRVRGMSEPLSVWLIPHARDLPTSYVSAASPMPPPTPSAPRNDRTASA
jgi:adenylate cyclase